MLKGKAKKDYQRDYMRRKRSNSSLDPIVRPVLDPVRPSKLDPSVRPDVEPPTILVEPLPNCPDGRYRPYTKEEQTGVKMTKSQVTKKARFSELKTKFDTKLTR